MDQQILTYLVIAVCIYFIYREMCQCSAKKESFAAVSRIDDNQITVFKNESY